MQGDFSLNPLAYRAGVSRVLHQQGRVQLDSDANEQVESLLHFSRGLAVDLIGAHAQAVGHRPVLHHRSDQPTGAGAEQVKADAAERHDRQAEDEHACV